jgi:nicotinamidase/pyrazinamidase
VHALLIVDIQNDFLPGGALAVPKGDEVIPIANALMPRFPLVVASQDWHPADHASFASQHPGSRPGAIIELRGSKQVVWPDHCVQHTHGAEFPPELNVAGIHHVVQKGTDREVDSYSAFFDNDRQTPTGLENFLHRKHVTGICVVGLATDYCVKFSVLDARECGYAVTVVREGIRGVGLQPGDCDRAVKEMQTAGARLIGVDEAMARA